MEKMQESFTAQLLQKDIEVKELKQKYEEMSQILQEIKGEICAERANTKELSETWRADFQQMKGEL
jgi:FtsZ-binding cell division protein ZapB